MKDYKILKSFKGSQDGLDHHHFQRDTVAKLSPSLAEIALSEGWASAIEKVAHVAPEEDVTPEETPVIEEITEEKAVKAAPANKAKKAAPENKSKK